jgi:hypothetical protein
MFIGHIQSNNDIRTSHSERKEKMEKIDKTKIHSLKKFLNMTNFWKKLMKRKRKKRRLEMFKKKEKHNLTKAIKK